MEEHFNELIDRIDAEVFSGDALCNKSNREHLKSTLVSWNKAIDKAALLYKEEINDS